MNNGVGILMGITLNLYIAFIRMIISTVLSAIQKIELIPVTVNQAKNLWLGRL